MLDDRCDLFVRQRAGIEEIAVSGHRLPGWHDAVRGVVLDGGSPGMRLLVGFQREGRGLTGTVAHHAVLEEDRGDVAQKFDGRRLRRDGCER